MKIIITAGEAQDKGIWEKLCDLKGIDIYALAMVFEKVLDIVK